LAPAAFGSASLRLKAELNVLEKNSRTEAQDFTYQTRELQVHVIP
jgi:hypothetical protein